MSFPRRLAVAPVLAFLALLATACVGTVNPEGWAAPVFTGQKVYFLESHDRLAQASLPSNGATRLDWVFPDKNNPAQKNINLQAVYGQPVVANGNIYLTSYSDGVFELDQSNGHPRWQMKQGISGNIVGGAAVGDGVVAFGTTDGHLYVVKASDHSPAPNWPASGVKLGAGIWTAPVIVGDRLFVATMGGNLYSYSIAKGPGQPLWSQPFRAAGGGAIADFVQLDATHLFVPSINRHVYILDISDPSKAKVQVDFTASDWVWTRPAFQDNVVYFGDFGGNVYAVDITKGPNGKMLWPAPASTGGNRVKAGPAIVDNVLVLADRKPAVLFIDVQTGKVLNSVPINNAGTVRAPVAAHDGLAYIVTTDGSLFVANAANRSVSEVNVSGRQ